MQEKYWRELLEMFDTDGSLKETHPELYRNVDLIVENLKLQDRLQEISESLKELNELKKED